MLGLLQTSAGLPIGYDLFPGNTADVETLTPAIEAMKKRHSIGQVVIVAESGMMGADNPDTLVSLGFAYVVAARVHSIEESVMQRIGEREWVSDPLSQSFTERRLNGRRLIVRRSPRKAAKDRHDRKDAVGKLKKRVEQGIKGKGRRGRILKLPAAAVTLDTTAVERDEWFDGLHAAAGVPHPRRALENRGGLPRPQANDGRAPGL